MTSWIFFLSLENFLRIRKMLKSAPEQNDKRHLVLLQHLLILEAPESSTAHDLGLIGSADFRERANRIVKMTQISILNQLLRKLKSNIWLLNKTRKALPYFNFKIEMANDDVIQSLLRPYGWWKSMRFKCSLNWKIIFGVHYRGTVGYQILTMGMAMISC